MATRVRRTLATCSAASVQRISHCSGTDTKALTTKLHVFPGTVSFIRHRGAGRRNRTDTQHVTGPRSSGAFKPLSQPSGFWRLSSAIEVANDMGQKKTEVDTVPEGPNHPRQVEAGSMCTPRTCSCLGQGLGGPYSYRFDNQAVLGCSRDIGVYR